MVEKAPMGYYDLILMDIQMPCMDGYESTRRIRKLPDERSQTPIVAMTANAFEEDRKAAFAVGMNGYVVKPIELPVLMETMAAVLPQAGSPVSYTHLIIMEFIICIISVIKESRSLSRMENHLDGHWQ